jgi:glycolate oxidase FAD binding subunit
MSAPLPGRAPFLRALIDICGPDFARVAGPADAVAGRVASFVAVPATTTGVVDTMRLAAERGLAVVPRGAGTKLDWGAPPPGVDLLLDTGRLAGVWHHRPAELTAEVGTGTSVRAVQAALALRGQRLAVDPPSAAATIGGMLAVNESGPLRHRFGTPNEQVNHVSYVDLDGRPAESDGEDGRPGIAEIRGVIMSANLRLMPLPAARRWVTAPVSTPWQVNQLVGEALALDLAPSAIELDLPAAPGAPTGQQSPGSLAVLLEGGFPAVQERAERLAKTLGDGVTVSEIAPRWWGRYPFGTGDVALRISVPIGELAAAVYALRDATRGPVPVRGSAGLGSVHAVLPGDLPPDQVEGVLDTVRSVLMARGGRAVIISAPPAIARAVDMADSRDLF